MMNDKAPTPISAANSRYAGVELSDSILTDDVLIDLLARGVVNQEEIRKALDASSWFVRGDEPSWRAVWHAFERDDEATAAAVVKMLKDFADRKFHRSGEILHLFAEMLWLADIGMSGMNRAETVVACRGYVDDLRKDKKLEPVLQRFADGINFGSYGGLGFNQRESAEFRDLHEYLFEQRKLAEIEGFPEEAKRLADLAETDQEQFGREIAFLREAKGTFADVPVFVHLNVDEFAKRLITLPATQLHEVLLAFSVRYDMGALANRLKDERDWAEKFEATLKEQANTLDAFGRDRVSKMVRFSIGKELNELRQAEGEQKNA